MTSSTTSRIQLPTRAELRLVSLWVWVMLGIAAAEFVLVLAAEAKFGINAVSSAALSAAPAILAAALLDVAPRHRLVRIAAFGFVVPVILGGIRIVLESGAAEPNTISADYALLVPRLHEWTEALSSVAWMFTAVAVAALAMYIGRVTTRRGWAIVAVAVVMAASLIVYAAQSWLPLLDPELGQTDILPRMILSSSSLLALIAWGFLAAVAVEQRLWLIAMAAGAHLLGHVPSLLTFVFGAPVDLEGVGFQLLLVSGFVSSAVTWTALIAGVLIELPRHGQTTATDTDSANSQEAFSFGR